MSLASGARDSATALDSLPDLPVTAPPPLALEKGMFSASSSPPRPHPLLPPLLLSLFPLLGFQCTAAAAGGGIGSCRFRGRRRQLQVLRCGSLPLPGAALLSHSGSALLSTISSKTRSLQDLRCHQDLLSHPGSALLSGSAVLSTISTRPRLGHFSFQVRLGLPPSPFLMPYSFL